MKIKNLTEKVEKIKSYLAKGYNTSSIIEIMDLEFKTKVTGSQIQSIKCGEAHLNIASHLNEQMFKNYKPRIKNTEDVADIKFFLAHGYAHEEILESYKITEATLRKIIKGFMPYKDIASQYNYKIEERYGKRQRGNLKRSVVLAIKKDYINNNGKILLKDLSEKHNLEKSIVSNILTFRTYKSVGTSFNTKIKSIKKKNYDLKKKKEKEKLENRIAAEKEKLNKIKQDEMGAKEKIKSLKDEIKKI